MTQSYVLMFLCKLPRVWIKCEMNERLQSENFSAGRRRRHQPPTPKITGGYLNLSPEVVRFLIFPMQWCDPSRISHTHCTGPRSAEDMPEARLPLPPFSVFDYTAFAVSSYGYGIL